MGSLSYNLSVLVVARLCSSFCKHSSLKSSSCSVFHTVGRTLLSLLILYNVQETLSPTCCLESLFRWIVCTCTSHMLLNVTPLWTVFLSSPLSPPQPPLIQAIFSGDPEEIRMLIYKSEDINALVRTHTHPHHTFVVTSFVSWHSFTLLLLKCEKTWPQLSICTLPQWI